MTRPRPSLHLPLDGSFTARIGAGDVQAHAQMQAAASGPHRLVAIGGKCGWQALSRKTLLQIPSRQHLQDQGSFVLWVAATETLAVSPPLQHVHDRHADWQDYGLLADTAPTNDIANSVFAWSWRSYWHPQMVAKFMGGPACGAAADHAATPYVPVEHLTLPQRQWVQLALTFDKPASRFRVHVNGVLCGTTRYPFACQTPGPDLFLGNTVWGRS